MGKSKLFNHITGFCAGFLTATNNTLEAISLVSILFTGILKPYVGIASQNMMVGMAICQLVALFHSKTPRAVYCLAFEASPFVAIITDSILEEMVGDSAKDVLATTMCSYALLTGLVGLAFYVVGLLKMGKMVNFVPYPVRNGLFAAVGYVLYKFSWELASDNAFTIDNITDNYWKLLALHIIGIGLFVSLAKWKSPLTVPVMFLGGIVIMQVIIALSGESNNSARESFWLMEKSDTLPFYSLYESFFEGSVNFSVFQKQIPTILIAVVVGPVLNGNINTVMVGPLLDQEIDQNHEMTTHGFSNLAACVTGGFASNVAVSSSSIHMSAGGKTKLSVFWIVVVQMTYFLAHWTLAIVPFMPRAVVGALFLNFACDFLYQSLYVAYKKVSRVEYCAVLIILLSGVVRDVSVAFLVGLVLSFMFFIHRYARVQHIVAESDNSHLCSWVVRSDKSASRLAKLGHSIKVFRLQGYIFFASFGGVTGRITEVVEESKAEGVAVTHIVLDMQQVPGMDTTAMSGFLQMVKTFKEMHNIQVLMVLQPQSQLGEHMKRAKMKLKRRSSMTNAMTHVELNDKDNVFDDALSMESSLGELGSFRVNAAMSLAQELDSGGHATNVTLMNRAHRRHSFHLFNQALSLRQVEICQSLDEALELCEDHVLGIKNEDFIEHRKNTITQFIDIKDMARNIPYSRWEMLSMLGAIMNTQKRGLIIDGKCPILDTGLTRFKYFGAGEVVFWEGDVADGIYLLASGRLTSYSTPSDDMANVHDISNVDRARAETAELSLTVFLPESMNRLWVARHPGTPIGSVFYRTLRQPVQDETVVADVDSVVWHLPSSALQKLGDENDVAEIALFDFLRAFHQRKFRFLKLKMKFSNTFNNSSLMSSQNTKNGIQEHQ